MDEIERIAREVRQSKIDPLQESASNLLVVTFGHSTSKNFRAALELAYQAQRYQCLVEADAQIHVCVFGRTRVQAAAASMLIRQAAGWKSFQLWAGGKLFQNAYRVQEILHCYLAGASLDDPRAHCVEVIDDPTRPRDRSSMSLTIKLELPKSEWEAPDPATIAVPSVRYLFPCKLLRWRFRPAQGHPSSLQERLRAFSISEGCDWCPLFDAQGFRPVEGP